ncbi:UDP-N-acetylglucosamine/UDP-N-acetylgalactosaminediphosphorylase [Clostridium collagenovorans DSM 3089]|uniref:UDP-N-acetylglucosamine/UDP-N-acetylgalactosamine diphosphorylase n=1 Tax=Clostridium collagenovorans DSM 3089 TaxID=1121306 RepID=A0A1M5V9H6_9CLOT|nr:UTP--glucose-1-phosphate uridylyltransferase [Clostridium collagenovorans]SHH71861.1 UDP-N-acetylglucosamine/UDP-N-acetylgalactosaminediphosphorylase [Clostridium collagenovorans DSM 3089]
MERIIEDLKQYKQLELIQHLEKLSLIKQEKLIKSITNLDKAFSIYSLSKMNENNASSNDKITAAKHFDIEDASNKEELFKLGIEALKNGEVAILLLAGGQGTRLGHNGPKGTYSIGLPSGKSFFQLQAEQLTYMKTLTGKSIPWYIMTSLENNYDTIKTFKENNYYGLEESAINFFIQDELPIISFNGDLLLKNDTEILKGSNGNGGVFESLIKSDNIKRMKNQGVKWLFIYGIDNMLVKVADPYFIGFTIKSGLDCSSKSVKRLDPEENGGVFCYRNNKPSILEYTEIDDEIKYSVDDNGELKYNDLNILCHMIKLDALENIAKEELPYHRAIKSYEVLSENGKNKVEKGYKFEMFIFDIFNKLQDMAIMRVNRELEFLPVKNKSGKDSAEVAREVYLELSKNWLIKQGTSKNIQDNKEVEIPITTLWYKNSLD